MHEIRTAYLFISLFAALPAFAEYVDGRVLNERLLADDRINGGTNSPADVANAAQGLGYITGVADVMISVNTMCPPTGAKAGQVYSVAKKYIQEHPERWHFSGSTLVIEGLSAAFPCKK